MNILIATLVIVSYMGIAMAFYFGFHAADEVGEPFVNFCCALSWPLIVAVCIIIGPFFSFWFIATVIHGTDVLDQ